MVFDAVAFRQSVLEVVSLVPLGKVVSYGLVARRAGWPNHSRMVGRVLHGLSESSGLPCHRIVNNEGRTAPCWPEQVGLLKSELFYFEKFKSIEDFKEKLDEYIDYYNNRRIKVKLKGLSPVEYRTKSLRTA